MCCFTPNHWQVDILASVLETGELSESQIEASTSLLTTELTLATESEEQESLLPLDLNTTNEVMSTLLDISEETDTTVDEVSMYNIAQMS